MNDALSTGRITPKEREALHALIDSGALAAAKLEKQKSLLAKRKEVRARLQPLPAMKIDLAKKETAWFELVETHAQARHALNMLGDKVAIAYTAMQSVQTVSDRLQHSVNWELRELADPRVHSVAAWLARMRQIASAEFHIDRVIQRKVFGNQVTTIDNSVAVKAALAAVDSANTDLEDLVLSSNAIDFGPDLERIRDAVLKAFAPLVDGLWQFRRERLELNLSE